MKRIILVICILCFVVLFCCACGLFGDRKFTCDVSNIESVCIVRLDEYLEEKYQYEYTVLSHISNYETFVDRLNNLEHSVNWGEPCQLNVQYVVIRIDYLNGDFDLIHQDAQCFNRSGKNRYGYFFFEDEQFNELIGDYINGECSTGRDSL